MEVKAFDLTGYKMDNEIFLRNYFRGLREKEPNIGLDEAILRFEKSDEKSLRVFARKRGRTAEGYRESYGKYF